MLSLKCHEAAFNNIAGALIRSSLQLELDVGAWSLALSQSASGNDVFLSIQPHNHPLFQKKRFFPVSALLADSPTELRLDSFWSPCQPLLDVEAVSK